MTAVTIKVVENPFIALSSSIHQGSLDLTESYLSEHSILQYDAKSSRSPKLRCSGVAPATPRWHDPHVAGLERSQCGMPWREKRVTAKTTLVTNLAGFFTGRFLNLDGFGPIPVAQR